MFAVVLAFPRALASTVHLRLGAAGRHPATSTPARPTTCSPRASAPASTARSRRRRRPGRPRRRATRRVRAEESRRSSAPPFNATRPVASSSPRLGRSRGDRRAGSPPARTVVPAAIGGGGAQPMSAARRRRSRTSPTDPPAAAAIPALMLGITFLVLAMAFRSIVIALKAAITTSCRRWSASACWRWWCRRATAGPRRARQTGPIESFLPPIVFAILFGLWMDYVVFLISRIREEHVHGRDDARGRRARHRGIGRVDRGRRDHHGHGLRGVHPQRRPHPKEFGLLLAVAILDRRAGRADDARPVDATLLGESRGTSRAGSTASCPTSRSRPRTTAPRAGPSRPAREVVETPYRARRADRRSALRGSGNPCLAKRLRIDDPAAPPRCSSRSAPDSRRVWPSASLPPGGGLVHRRGLRRPGPSGHSRAGWGSVARARAPSSPGCPSSTRRR